MYTIPQHEQVFPPVAADTGPLSARTRCPHAVQFITRRRVTKGKPELWEEAIGMQLRNGWRFPWN
jgi:hypothetical protein